MPGESSKRSLEEKQTLCAFETDLSLQEPHLQEMCLFSLMLIRGTIWFSVNCFRIHIARDFSSNFQNKHRERLTEREREGGGERERERQTPDRDLEALSMFIFSWWVFSLGTLLRSCSLSKASSFPFIKAQLPSSLSSVAHSIWRCWVPHSQCTRGWTTVGEKRDGNNCAYIFSNQHIIAALGQE